MNRPDVLDALDVKERKAARDLDIGIKSIGEPASPDDGRRILVNTSWPAGITREEASLSEWRPDWAPASQAGDLADLSDQQWHDFCERYRAELLRRGKLAEIRVLATMSRRGRVTLVYSGGTARRNLAVALLGFVSEG